MITGPTLVEGPQETYERARRRFDAVSLISVVIFVNLVMPARASVPPFGAAGRPAALLGFVCLLWWLLEAIRGDHPGRRLTPSHYAHLLRLAAVFLSLGVGMNRVATAAERSSGDRTLLLAFSGIGIAFICADCVRSYADLELLLRRAVTAGSIVSVLAIIQFGFGYGFLEPTQYLVPPGFAEVGGSPPIEWRGGIRRVSGTAQHPIELGVVAAGLLLFALHFAFHAKGRIDAQRRWLEVGLLTLGVAVSLSRSGLLTLATGGLIMISAWSLRQRIIAAVSGLVGLALFYLLDPRVINVFVELIANSGDDSSIDARTDDYDLVPALIAEYPITGRGAGTFLPSEYFILDNQVLGTLIQTGVFGLIGFLALYASGFLLPRHVRHLAGGEGEVARLAQTMCGVVAAGFVATFTFDSHGFPIHRTMLFITIGLGTAMWRLAQEGELPGIASAEERALGNFSDQDPKNRR